MSASRIGVDVGGTFTDVAVESAGELRVAKVASTPSDQAEGVMSGVGSDGVELGSVGRFVHGTTVATNAVLERRGSRTALVVTEGFRDLLEIGRQNRPKLYDLFADRPPPLVPRDLVLEVSERVGAEGDVVRQLSSDEVARVVEAVRAFDAGSVAVCLLFSFLRPEHERAIGDALRAAGIDTSVSHEVLPVFREYERASTTALNAYVAPVMRRYLRNLDRRLRDGGLAGPVEVMRSSGGTSTAELAGRFAVHTMLSGPAAGAWGAAAVARAAGFDDVVAFDMGGTSTDATFIQGGRPSTTSEGSIGGLPFGVPTTEIHTVGAGGGSVAWVDSGGSLRVGPRSAGADPGPACYGRGGDEPTVTDVYVVLGWLGPDDRLGGSVELDADAARGVVGRLAAKLGLDVEACAEGIVEVLEAQVTTALRVVSVERGRDPRRSALLPFGGAGPIHQGPLARGLGSAAALVPPHAGVLSALGLLATPTAVDLVRTRLTDLAEAARQDLEGEWASLEEEARGSLRAQGIQAAKLSRSADCRYRGQAFELEVSAPTPDPARIAGAFHDAHEERYGYAQREEPVELVNVRVRAQGPPAELALPKVGAASSDDARRGDRTVRLGGDVRTVVVYDRDALGHGAGIEGPALVTGIDSTCLLLPGQRADVDPFGVMVVR
jgi:N-methylhydantoinase A